MRFSTENEEKKGKGQRHNKYTKKKRKTACGLVSTKRKSSFVAFVENDGDDEDDKQNSSWSKLSVTWSVSTRCHALTIFENEAVMWLRHLLFIVRFFLWYKKTGCKQMPPKGHPSNVLKKFHKKSEQGFRIILHICRLNASSIFTQDIIGNMKNHLDIIQR